MSTSKQILKERLESIKNEKDGVKSLQKSIVVLELPFVVEEREIKKYFVRCGGGVERLELFRSGALVFSSAIIEFKNKSGVKEAMTLTEDSQFGGEFDVLVFTAEDFLAGKDKKRDDEEDEKSQKSETKKKCPVQ